MIMIIYIGEKNEIKNISKKFINLIGKTLEENENIIIKSTENKIIRKYDSKIKDLESLNNELKIKNELLKKENDKINEKFIYLMVHHKDNQKKN